jgi:hypothetical protein
MNYFKHYIQLVDSRQSRGLNREFGYEIHHIVPRCIGGDDSAENLVKLTYREHYIAHMLLHKSYKEDEKLLRALTGMSMGKHRGLTSRQVSILKGKVSTKMTLYNPMHNTESRTKMSETRKHKFGSGEWVPREITQEERAAIATRMKDCNPMSREPWKNHTASPVRIHYLDGTTQEFRYLKEVSILTGVPYDTLKYASRLKTGSPKWGIQKIEKLPCEG